MKTGSSTIISKSIKHFNNGDSTAIQELIADDDVWHIPGESRSAGEYPGKQELAEKYLVNIKGILVSVDLVYKEVYTGPDNLVVGTSSRRLT